MNIITKKITLRLCVLMLSVLALTFTLIGCPTADSSSGDSSSSNNNNNNEPAKVCGLDNPEKINVLSQDVGLYHILLDICTNEDIDEIGFAVNTTQAPVAKNTISAKYGYVTRKFTKGVTRPIFFTVKTDATSDNALTVAADGLAPNTQYYVHLYYGTADTKTIAIKTPNYPTADPGNVFTLSPPNNMTYEVKIAEPFILGYYLKFTIDARIRRDGISKSFCDNGNICNPTNSNSGLWVFSSGGSGTNGTPNLVNKMGYIKVAISGTTLARFDNKATGIITTERDDDGLPAQTINYTVVTE